MRCRDGANRAAGSGHSRGAAAGGSAGALPAGTAAKPSAPRACGSQGLFSRNSGVPGKGAVRTPQVCAFAAPKGARTAASGFLEKPPWSN